MGMDQYLYIPFLGGWTSIYQLFWCSPGVHGFDPSPNWREKQRQGKQKKQTRKPKKKKNQENKTHTKKKKIWEQPSCCFYVSFVCLLILSCGSCGFVCFFLWIVFRFFAKINFLCSSWSLQGNSKLSVQDSSWCFFQGLYNYTIQLLYIKDYHPPLWKSLVNSQQIDMTFRVLNPLDYRGSPCLWSYTWNMTINSCFSWDVTDVTPFFFGQFWVCPIYSECFPPRKSIRW